MPLDFPCTSCQRTIRVPDGSEGKKTACPKCGEVQRIPGQRLAPGPDIPYSGGNAEETPPVPETVPESETPSVPETPSVSEITRASQTGTSGQPTNPFGDADSSNPYASPAATADISRFDATSGDIDRAKLTLMGPAIATMIVAGISWLFNCGVMAMYVALGAAAFVERPAGPAAREEWILFWSMIGGLVLVTAITGVIFAAMSRALKLRNYGFVLTGFILAAIPCTSSYCCVLALPFSIWGIVVLCDNSVKAAFSRP